MALPVEIQQELDRLQNQVNRLNAELNKFRDPTKPDIAQARALHEMGEVPSVFLYSNAVQTITDATNPVLALNLTVWDTDGLGDLVNDRIQFRTSGIYLVSANVTFALNSTGSRGIDIQTGNDAGSFGGVFIAGQMTRASAAEPTVLSVSGIVHVNVNTNTNIRYVRASIFQDSGGNLDTIAGSAYSSHLSAIKVSELPQIVG